LFPPRIPRDERIVRLNEFIREIRTIKRVLSEGRIWVGEVEIQINEATKAKLEARLEKLKQEAKKLIDEW